MNQPKQIALNAFNMSTVGHICHGMWTHPRDRSSQYGEIDEWVSLAKTLERGKFDGLFLADVLGINDVGGGASAAIEGAVQVPITDPSLVISAMAHATTHLGFGVTVNLTYEKPYLTARRFSTLDSLTKGRIGWNIVTGYLNSAARAMGLTEQIRHDDRYDMADDYMDVFYKLLENSWDDDAVLRDRASGRYTDASKVRRITHAGPYYGIDAMHLCEPTIQRTPVLYQAGGSKRGLQFAAKHAECVFMNLLTVERTRLAVHDIRRRAVENGRRADDIKVFSGIIVITGETEKIAKEKYEEYQRYANPMAGLTHFCSTIGIDLTGYDIDEPITAVETQAMVSALQTITQNTQDGPYTVRRLLDMMKLGCRSTPIVGSGRQVAEQLWDFVKKTGIDGFNLMRVVTPETFEDFVDYVVPELQSMGVYKEDYAAGALREKLFVGNGARLPSRHHAATFRSSNR